MLSILDTRSLIVWAVRRCTQLGSNRARSRKRNAYESSVMSYPISLLWTNKTVYLISIWQYTQINYFENSWTTTNPIKLDYSAAYLADTARRVLPYI